MVQDEFILDDFLEQIYLYELFSQGQLALEAVARMNNHLKGGGTREFFQEASSLLSHAAAMSRLLWPPRIRDSEKMKRAESRGRQLRAALSLNNDHPLHRRNLRDHLEHFDERLDDWAVNSRNRIILDHNIGPRSAFGGDAVDDSDFVRHFDPTTKIFIFRGEHFDIQALVDDVVDVKNRAESRLVDLETHQSGSSR